MAGARVRSARSGANSAGSCAHLSLPTIKSGTGTECKAAGRRTGSKVKNRKHPAMSRVADAFR
jgi:hypothetical protein